MDADGRSVLNVRGVASLISLCGLGLSAESHHIVVCFHSMHTVLIHSRSSI
jgi:hypothetical protein